MSKGPSVEGLRSKITRKLIGTLHVDLDRDLRNTVFLAGSGRSGTTWLSHVINYRNQYRYLFEPFHPHQVGGTNLPRPNGYLAADADAPEALSAVRATLEGRARNRWVDHHNKRILARRRLVKDVWSNLYLAWIARRLPQVRIVFLLRHPCAVANSRLKAFHIRGQWSPELPELLAQRDLVEAHLEPWVSEIRAAERAELFDRLVFKWCIESLVPLRELSGESVLRVHYEHLCNQPEAALPPLLEHAGDRFEPAVMQAWRRVSSTRHDDSPILTGGDLVGGWREQITEAQCTRAQEILELFGLTWLYRADRDLPLDPSGASEVE